jgi:hypothetical protein
MGKSASFVAEYLLQNVIQNPPKLKLVTNAKQEVEIENTIRGLFILSVPTNEATIIDVVFFFHNSIVSYLRYVSCNII